MIQDLLFFGAMIAFSLWIFCKVSQKVFNNNDNSSRSSTTSFHSAPIAYPNYSQNVYPQQAPNHQGHNAYSSQHYGQNANTAQSPQPPPPPSRFSIPKF